MSVMLMATLNPTSVSICWMAWMIRWSKTGAVSMTISVVAAPPASAISALAFSGS
jgi:hypothetical protein